ncbi:S8 family serine peptidase [Alteromonas sp. ASW11-19]|uniref:S8 family serine peptidase n=1 Tax=Alteromonas salexigens TaxID=2982530 RepID=A0ABT2VLN1_9ALTE|nr:S8 family serine peptidase [Alteromonas salexigens]MCU7553727.1 S8 family serine peptidase [Alteromonas salexigens]
MFKTTIKPTLAATLLALGSASVAAQTGDRYIIQVDNNSKGIVKALAKQSGADIHIDANGFIAATFSGKSLSDVKGLMNNPHVKLVEQDHERRPMALYNDDAGDPDAMQITPYAVYQAQANQVTFDANAGMKVCVIDSGLDSSNPDFVWSRITGDNDPGTGNWFDNGGPHGTHVAGTIGAADNSYGVIGMAPGVDMHIIKVFNAEGWGYSSDLAYAAQKCADAGANIINMSLGGGGANSTEENAFIDFVNNGGFVVAAAGNDGNNVRSYPAGYPAVMMIGANDADDNIASFSQYPSCTSGRGKNATSDETICVEVTAGGVDTLSTYPAGGATMASMTADGAGVAASAMENAGTASATTYFMGIGDSVDTNASGKVCLIDRGSISFYDKVNNCEQSGGVGAVVINNEPGMLYGTLGETNDTTIPAVGAAQEDRAQLLAATTVDISIGASDYGYMSGTSMATPAVAGVAALVWSNHPTCTGEEIRSALKATARDAGAAGKDVYFGHGIVQAADANDYLTANGCAGGGSGGGGTGGGSDLSLTANGYKVKGMQTVDLSWSNATGNDVDIYRDGSVITTTANDGAYTDSLNKKGGGVYDYQVCEAGTTTCSATVTVVF